MSTRPITDTLRYLQGGTFLDEASEAMAELVSAVDATGKGGKLTIEISVKKMSKGACGVIGKVKISAPSDAPDATLMFPTPEGNLLTEDPRQQKLQLKVAGAEAESDLKKVGAN